MNKPPLTAKGAQRLREQLEALKKEERPSIVRAIAEARAHGDLSENAEYHAAREKQSFIEGRIAELEHVLAIAQIIDVTTVNADGSVVFGCTVELLNKKNHRKSVYRIVGELEADIDQGLLSVSSPIARALIGRRQGEVVDVETPDGVTRYEIGRVHYE